jgi:hypothetical protein
MFSIYLRPSPDFVLEHMDELSVAQKYNEKWGGIHATLCSFAPVINTESKLLNYVHHSNLTTVCDDLQNIILQKIMQNKSPFTCNSSYDSPLNSIYIEDKTTSILTFREASIICDSLRKHKLVEVRTVDSLHMSLGPSVNIDDAEIMCDALNQCQQWELVIMEKSSKGEVKVTETRIL